MNWYIAKIVFGIRVGESKTTAQFDEQLRVISARNEKEAFLKARMIGVREEESFLNAEYSTVRWEFIDVSELNPLAELTDGMELYSCIHETESDEGYIRFIQHKAANIEERIQQQPVAAQ